MKNKNTTLTFTNVINIRVAIKCRIQELQEKKSKCAKALGKKYASSCYNSMIKESISAYRAAGNIPIVY